ncbi:hypothetical protein 3 [Wenzhou tombus-like virus 18]|uniref:Uncharacterized protein n=1 Tax=Wenzhou tombus-like virus 18 TaxID=1923671 RepID=A0ACD6B8Y9_9VIRU|nr:hypothetical protein 3 [Wenzhou tombus-like virus 18]APG76098.1 hypothetical protein 3 [Wenzhou tombus-like virus 18]6IZL_A Chain A, mud crab tombus-like virus [Wenzhou tombus-like virus 18]6IZL_B Chain B, mud crab tombus-like virus [Wenzhou tombus-like virus 18]6IZL_C Chain C, mud crab tombus-like virus [Wenzhou tombus-like virus 18]
MTGSNRRANAGRKTQPKPQRKPRAPRRPKVQNAPRIQQGGGPVPLLESNSNMRQMHNGMTRVVGSDYLGVVSVAGNPADAAAKVRKVLSVSPSSFPGTRLTQMSDLWERYVFRQFRVRYVPSVPNTLACQVMVYQDTDPQDDPTAIKDADALLRQATAQTGSQQWNFNSAKVIHLAKRSDNQLYYTGPVKENPRFNQQGVVYFIQVSQALDMNGKPLTADMECGSLYVDWVIDFQTPQVNPSAVEARLPSAGFFTRQILVNDKLTFAAQASLTVALTALSATPKVWLEGPTRVDLATLGGPGGNLVQIELTRAQPGDYTVKFVGCDSVTLVSSAPIA